MTRIGVIVMDDGAIVMDGTPREVFSQVEKLKEYRLDVPQATELAYELKRREWIFRTEFFHRKSLWRRFWPAVPGNF